MPIFATKEQYTCGHATEMRHKRTGEDQRVFTETLPMPYPCLGCLFKGLLDAHAAPTHSRVAELRGPCAENRTVAPAQAVQVGRAGELRVGGSRLRGRPVAGY